MRALLLNGRLQPKIELLFILFSSQSLRMLKHFRRQLCLVFLVWEPTKY